MYGIVALSVKDFEVYSVSVEDSCYVDGNGMARYAS